MPGSDLQSESVPPSSSSPAGTSTGRGPRRGVPRWLRVVAGVVCVLVGAFLALRPFTSLAFLLVSLVAGLIVGALGLFAEEGVGSARRRQVLQGVLFLIAAAVILAWPGPTIRVLAWVVGIALLAGGILDLVAVRGAQGTARWNVLVGGLSSLIFGVLALAWPDVTVLVVAIVFGARVVILGVRLVVSAARGEDQQRTDPLPRARPGWWRLAGNVVGATVAVLLLLVSIALNRGSPSPGAFYDAPPDLPNRPGVLLRTESFSTAEIPAGAKAWRILYTTTRADGQPAVGSGIVVAPDSATGQGAPAKVVAWAHGTTGATPGCAPSLVDKTFSSGAMFVQDKVIGAGWAIVGADYIGLGTVGPHAYLVGQPEGRAVLDAVRAAHQMTQVRLADDTVVWGHSQGGGAALWSGVLAGSYAPELKILGVAALAPASNLPGLVENIGNVQGGELFASYVVEGYTSTYPDVTYAEYVRPSAQLIVREMSQRCLTDKSILVSVLSTLLFDKPIWEGDPYRGPLKQRLQENIPSGAIDAPLLVAQGAADSLVVPSAQDEYVSARCAAGYSLDYRKYAGRDHVPLVEADSPLIPERLMWTQDRIDGKPSTNTCRAG